ncbi:hypothetical protein HRG_002924 [Hirsutella rhossiliensis]|uniref:Uncharacterized protein n=1 Tax=Hirsutella rhossiliensis TaxID=111463 RepID=A0A9P8SJ44_9HYPO|nr:uncharacterized protein HRG_02924 [Hirsutella rhossiliensis]KAH0964908.1 hypothetical protein HRG_02924 [Hirsutella rhossiliensis]
MPQPSVSFVLLLALGSCSGVLADGQTTLSTAIVKRAYAAASGPSQLAPSTRCLGAKTPPSPLVEAPKLAKPVPKVVAAAAPPPPPPSDPESKSQPPGTKKPCPTKPTNQDKVPPRTVLDRKNP